MNCVMQSYGLNLQRHKL